MTTQDPATGYAFWISPDGSRKVFYSLAVFHEIDAVVNDGYRRIPHGGVEIGGILFGHREGNDSRIEAFRQIECQHAFGPAFVLSESDLAGIRNQLESYREDSEIAPLEPLGWFIGHTRSPLQLSDREAAWFEELFHFADAISLLVKPEKFQPTHFGFLLRKRDGKIERDASRSAVILPLSAGTTSARPPSPSIPAHAPLTARPAPSREDESIEGPEDTAEPLRTSTRRTPRAEPEPPVSAKLPERPPAELPPPSRPVSTGGATRVRHQPSATSMPPPVPSPSFPYASLPERPRPGFRFGLQSALVLVLAAILGCVAGYWAYLQLPSPVIPVSVREQTGHLVVEWPSALTEKVDYAALQVNDGQWVTLSPQEKTAGHAVVAAPPGDVKIDLLAKHWLRDSRGIVRYLRR
jgi:hypothetical protein